MGQTSGKETIVIVGAGQAGASSAERLRKLGFSGRVLMVGAERHLPYQRPPLSKKYLSGEWPMKRLLLRPEAFWQDIGVEILLGCVAENLDLAARTIRLGREVVTWDKLLLATGTLPRNLPGVGADLAGMHVTRGIDDVDAMRDSFVLGNRLVIIGGGYVGLETAAVARTMGLDVTMVEAAQRILSRVACAQTAAFFADLHRARGVILIEGATVKDIEGKGRVTGVALDDRVIPADLVLTGIGVLPETRLAEDAGIACDDGILVDRRGRTSAPGVWAAGDCARFDLGGVPTRLENVQNAIDQAANAAEDMLGQGSDYAPVPWFWSDHYEVKLQIAGLGTRHDAIVTVKGTAGRSHWYFRNDRLVAVDAIDDAGAFMVAKRLLAAGTSFDPGRLTAPGFEPKQLLG